MHESCKVRPSPDPSLPGEEEEGEHHRVIMSGEGNDFPPSCCCISDQTKSDGQSEYISKVPCTGPQFLAVLKDGILTPWG